jgi:hypothetical protein
MNTETSLDAVSDLASAFLLDCMGLFVLKNVLFLNLNFEIPKFFFGRGVNYVI